MGLANSPATFVRLMNRIFAGTESYVIHYVDDILIFSDNEEEHIKHLQDVFQRLQDHQLCIKLSKCDFNLSEVDFCGVRVSGKGASMNSSTIDAMCEYPQITSFKEVQAFLGSVRFFAEFVPDLADIAQPLFALTKKDIISQERFKEVWTTNHQMIVRTIQFHLTSRWILHFFDPALETIVTTDVSDFALGGGLDKKRVKDICK